MNIEEKLNWLEKELKEAREEVEKLKGRKEREEIKGGEVYYYITASGGIDAYAWGDDATDTYLKETGNFFPKEKYTEKEIEKIARYRHEREKIEAIMKKYSRTIDPYAFNVVINYNRAENKIQLFDRTEFCEQPYFFKSEEIAKEAIKLCGEKKLIKYWFTSEAEYLESEVG